jgi:type III restriction system endonuclease
MSELYDKTYNPDVLSCLANLSNDEVFTPPEVANQMLDMLPKEIWSDPNATFLDPACKSGVFLREIAKRLIKGLEAEFPDLDERLEYIFKKQLHGVAITELTSLLSRRSVYCSKYPNSKYSVVEFDSAEGNIRFKRCEHKWVKGGCRYCGASEKEYERGDELETHAYEFIHFEDPKEMLPMKFDVVIGNPPYQLSDGGNGASAMPIYHKFVQQAKKLNPRYMLFIIPARWYDGGRGLNGFRKEMLTDNRISNLTDYPDSRDCFPGVDIAGGVCYFLWDRSYSGLCEVTSISRGNTEVAMRRLDEFETFIRSDKAVRIIEKVLAKNEQSLATMVSSQKPYGLRTFARPEEAGELTLRWNGGEGPFPREKVTSGIEWIDRWKVFTSYLTHDHAGQSDSEGKRRIISILEVAGPGKICTETYLSIGAFDSEMEAENLRSYVQTKFVRFLILQVTSTQHLSRSSFSFVPTQDFTGSS